MHARHSLILVGLVIMNLAGAAPIYRSNSIFRPVEAKQGMVVAAEKLAAEAGLAVLEDGGNAIDAAVTTGFALAVTLPRAGNIGGGGFMLFHEAETGNTYALDYRETAPLKAYRDMFLDEDGEADPDLSRNSPLAVGVPGTVAGLIAAHERFGSLPLERLLAPAIALARNGFNIHPGLAKSLSEARDSGRMDATASQVFFKKDGSLYRAGERLVQADLATSLERIAKEGLAGFYAGPTAQAIVETLSKNNGIMSLEDLADYKPVWRDPVSGTYRDFVIYSMPPPSSGGVHLIQMLRLLENFPLRAWGQNSGQTVHIMAEAMKRAYADRSKHLGDPDFADIPVDEILSEGYEQKILNRINSMTPTASSDIDPGEPRPVTESPETTHFSIVDARGNAVSNTYTLNFSYGSGIMAEGTGILLNNEMDDFSAKPGTPNAFGLIGGEANAVEPRKRMLSSMTPTIVTRNDEVHIVTGSPGGSRIINTVLQVALNVMEFELNAAEANNAPRFHHQWFPDALYVERGFPSDALHSLRLIGYPITEEGTIGSAQTIVRAGDVLTGATDPRRDGGAAVGY
ncbi:gamma-glutamyltransferase [Puniceicoccales bacterium CK1056]|uniref:Glutathione hydrolase proenzyme n=1 Tax=Oceanipulchritudo coccoides TaxID=2706888 RepID=A0A6B2M0Z2_9BACT|nr:gamma-glutamyltransferase [Oceanipulchritudo coccoides]NDV61774.1 gamma-glutamyltransferase [Oceanipulchritudo coccoides]